MCNPEYDKDYLQYCSNLDNSEYNQLWELYEEESIWSKIKNKINDILSILNIHNIKNYFN